MVDGNVGVEWLKFVFDIDDDLLGEDECGFYMLGGFIMYVFGCILVLIDYFVVEGWCFEVMDMDGNWVDKVLVFLVKFYEEGFLECI